jgi:hypothetical protein
MVITSKPETIRQLEETVKAQQQQIASLTSEKEQLEEMIATLKSHRNTLTPAQLVVSFASAMKTLRESLTGASEGGIGYAVSQFDVTLKTQVVVQGGDVQLLLPGPGENVVPESLSSVQFVLGAVPVSGS